MAFTFFKWMGPNGLNPHGLATPDLSLSSFDPSHLQTPDLFSSLELHGALIISLSFFIVHRLLSLHSLFHPLESVLLTPLLHHFSRSSFHSSAWVLPNPRELFHPARLYRDQVPEYGSPQRFIPHEHLIGQDTLSKRRVFNTCVGTVGV